MSESLAEAFEYLPPLDARMVRKVIPHRHPFLLIDGIREFGERSVIGYKALSMSDPVFQGHFPSEPVYPGVLHIETMAQAGACWILARKENLGKIAYLMTVESAKFRRPALPGMMLDIHGVITSYKKRTGKLEGEIYSNGELISSATVLFAFQKEDNGENRESG